MDTKKLSQTILFRASIAIPIALSAIAGFAIYYFQNFSLVLSDLWRQYKIPMAIASLSIPLAAWVTANHRSVQTMVALKLQKEKRLYEMYYEQQTHFEKVMGRRIENAKFQYITAEDLPVIFSELYEFNRIQQKGSVTLKSESINQINRFLNQTSQIVYDFYRHFSKHKEENPDQNRALDGFIRQLYTFLQCNLHQLSDEIGVKYIDLSDASVEIFGNAYTEVIQLTYYMGEDFKGVWDNLVDENGERSDENVINTFNAIENIIQKHMSINGSANFSNLQSDMSFKEVLKMDNATPLQRLVTNSCLELLENIRTRFKLKDTDILMIEGKYDKYQFPTNEQGSTLELWFDELSDTEGHLVLKSPDVDYKAKFTILDEEIEIDGKKQTKYTIDDDMGASFIKNCVTATDNALNNK